MSHAHKHPGTDKNTSHMRWTNYKCVLFYRIEKATGRRDGGVAGSIFSNE